MTRPDPIYVTRPTLPDLQDVLPYLERIWGSRILTNAGPLHQQLESELEAYLGVSNVSLVANGALALDVAMECLDLCDAGEVVTTPYSFVATTHAVRRAGLRPVFADIDPVYLNLDPAAVRERITPRTRAIVAVHCYGNPCDVVALQAIATEHGLKLIYDAAHAFGVTHRGESLLGHGDLAGVSFHATKVFNTFEGGAVISQSATMKQRIHLARNFGIADEVTVPHIGGNAKMSELNAAIGLCQLPRFAADRAARQAVDSRYRTALAGIAGLNPIPLPPQTEPNFSYFPIFVGCDFPLTRDALYERLKSKGVFSRRYFYPLLSELPMYRDEDSAQEANLPVATAAAQRVLCLPIYPDLSDAEQDRVVAALEEVRR